jgi:signal transduction histidine kinase
MVKPGIELSIARCRVVLSVGAMIAVAVDPTYLPSAELVGPSSMLEWLGSNLVSQIPAMSVIGIHVIYSDLIYYWSLRQARSHQLAFPARIAELTTWGDIIFAVAIAVVTQLAYSPYYLFFLFAVVAVGFRGGYRRTLQVTAASVILLFGVVWLTASSEASVHLMEPVYLGILGYLIGYLGQQRVDLEEELQELAAAQQRNLIARDLHDNHTQVLAAVNLKLESYRKLIRAGRSEDVLTDLEQFQGRVNHEYDMLRNYARRLAGQDENVRPQDGFSNPSVTVKANFTAPSAVVEQVLQMLSEGVANVRRHARARAAELSVSSSGSELLISVNDDGVGFDKDVRQPWSIASRAIDLGGLVRVERRTGSGAQLQIALPQS